MSLAYFKEFEFVYLAVALSGHLFARSDYKYKVITCKYDEYINFKGMYNK